jgi:hypothetical protein
MASARARASELASSLWNVVYDCIWIVTYKTAEDLEKAHGFGGYPSWEEYDAAWSAVLDPLTEAAVSGFLGTLDRMLPQPAVVEAQA